MTTIVAVSVSEQIEKFGAYAGFAAIIGLAVLSMLYFAQAREAKRLREWAASRPPETPQVPAAQQRVVPQPIARPAAPGAPATPGAPLTPAAQAAKPGPPVTPGATPAAVAAAASAAGADQPTEVRPAPTDPTDAPQGVPAPASPVAGQGAQPTIVSPPPARALRTNQPSATPPRTPAGSRPDVVDRAARRREASGGNGGGRGRSRVRTLLPIAIGVSVLLVLGLVVSGVIGGGSDTPPKQNSIAEAPVETSTTGTSGGATIDRSSTTVAVLNGTTVSGLARGVANNIEDGGFRLGTVENAADQTRAATSVEYVAGAEAEAKEVARLIELTADSVLPMGEGTRVLASGAQVVVTVGADQSPTGQP